MIRISDELRFFPDRMSREDAVVMIGSFDGVHVGHRTLIRRAHAMAAQSGAICRMLTFSPHPQQAIGNPDFRLIYTEEEKQEVVEETGLVDEMISLHFTEEVMHMDPTEFYREVLRERYRAVGIVVGDNFRFGNRGSGTSQLLKLLCDADGIPCSIISDVTLEGQIVSSTRIRNLLSSGEMEAAGRLLDRPYFVEGVVQAGKHLGRKMQTPTINICFEADQLIPQTGVYITQTVVGGQIYQSVSNIGCNPTFGEEEVRSETFIFDFSEDLYGQQVRVEFLKYIRPEQKFDSAEALQQRLRTDIDITRSYFGGLK